MQFGDNETPEMGHKNSWVLRSFLVKPANPFRLANDHFKFPSSTLSLMLQTYQNSLDNTEILTPERHVFSLRTTFGLRVGGASQAKMPAREDVTVRCAALRYPISKSKQGLTLVLTHGLSSHKESYHPTIAHLLRMNATGTRYVNMIREIWSIDMPNHGESAVLNRAYLEDRQERGRKEGWDGKCTTMDFTSYLDAFLSIPQLQGHRVVGIAHSGSSTPWTNVFTLLKQRTHPHPFALLFIEPVLMFPGMSSTDPRVAHSNANMRGSLAKRDKWSNRAEAKRWLLGIQGSGPEGQRRQRRDIDISGGAKQRESQSQNVGSGRGKSINNGKARGKTLWSKWDGRVLDLFVEHALEGVCESTLPLQGSANSTATTAKSRTYVRSMNRKEEESSLYAHSQHTIEPEHLAHMCAALGLRGGGVHIMWAESEEYISQSSRDGILDAASHRVLSDRVVPGSGHLVPQETPRELAETLYDVLVGHVAVAAGVTMRASL
ncbi:hypothetical protein BKA83DRAFT_4214373 [Pisolithus microcarpus]|nr:hypothetical protein BKA83DRAFT_4214373 [Pisolithus microcarpus]